MRSEGYCSWVGLSVCLLSHISPMERLFVLKTLSRTQRATKVKKFVGFSLKPFRCRDPALPPLYGHAYSRPFFHAYFSCTRMRISRHAHDTPPRVQHFSAFHYDSDHSITTLITTYYMSSIPGRQEWEKHV